MTKSLHPEFKILLVDDERPWLRSLSLTLEGHGGYNNLLLCSDAQEVMEILAQEDVGLILLDLTMPNLSGETLLEQIAADYPQITVVIVSGMNQVETAVKCLKLGAFDFIVKSVDEDQLLDRVHRAVHIADLERENLALNRGLLNKNLQHPEAFAEILSQDSGMHSIFQYVESVAATRRPILISGESGVGKELIAGALHKISGRSGSLVAVNVAGLDDNVFSDTLFGHVRGAFTGANSVRAGMIEQATGGTLFLDEIGDLSQASQVKLLRLLQSGEYYPLGSDQPHQMKARVVVATHQDLIALQQSGHFRNDLYYRLRTHHVEIIPLRKRRGDIPLLVNYFVEQTAEELKIDTPKVGDGVVSLLSNYPFPGNVRELKMIIYDAVSTLQGNTLTSSSFTKAIGNRNEPAALLLDEVQATQSLSTLEQLPTLSEMGSLLVAEAMRRAHGNQSVAARMLGISQPALSKRLKNSRNQND
ncbi:MAG: two-component system response regulator [Desulfobacteraceae bacterium 4572_35.1]|nr:MAG: two-component system response regulator [Desulfobacteraceae bacterium 4572_35.1]